MTDVAAAFVHALGWWLTLADLHLFMLLLTFGYSFEPDFEPLDRCVVGGCCALSSPRRPRYRAFDPAAMYGLRGAKATLAR